jgi:arylsulfatase A-like enzyme
MKRRRFLQGILGALTTAPAARLMAQPVPRTLIFVLADDMRWDAYGEAGDSRLNTPNLDWLVSTGHQFKNHFVTTSICPTSRASIYTGQYARRHGVWDFTTELSPTQVSNSLPMLLKKAGYQTAFFGKWGIGQTEPTDGFDHWEGFLGQGEYFASDTSEHLTDRLSRAATTWLKTSSNDAPRAVFIGTKAPHVQDDVADGFMPASRYKNLYEDVDFSPPPSASAEQFAKLPEFLRTYEGRRRWQNRFSSPELYGETVRQYHRLIRGVDDLVGEVVKCLVEKGELDQSMIVFSSDNGFFLGEHGLAGKWWGYEESIRTPLLIKLPGQAKLASTRIEALSLNIDIAPTILDYLGVPIPGVMQGKSLRPLIELKSEHFSKHFREHFLYEHLFRHPRIAQTVGLRSRDYKYLSYPGKNVASEMLFDLSADPYELNNLASHTEYKVVLEQYRAQTQAMLDENR